MLTQPLTGLPGAIARLNSLDQPYKGRPLGSRALPLIRRFVLPSGAVPKPTMSYFKYTSSPRW